MTLISVREKRASANATIDGLNKRKSDLIERVENELIHSAIKTEKYKSNTHELSDKQIQAEAILNALKSQEKINQKQKLIKFKAKTLEKDW